MEVGKVPIVSNNVWNESLWNKLPSCDIVIEKLFGIPCEALTGRVVITVANKVFNIAFSPVNENGVVDIWQTVPYYPKDALTSSKSPLEANFEIQIEVVEENQRVTKTLGICEVDMGNCVKSGMGELFCLPNDSSPFESVILPCIRVSLRHHEMDQLVTTTSTETASISESSVQIKHIQEYIVMDFEKDISLKWKNKTMSKPTTPMEDRRTHYADNWSKMNFESLETFDVSKKHISIETKGSSTNPKDMRSSKRTASEIHPVHSTSSEDSKKSQSHRVTFSGIEKSESRENYLESENRILRSTVSRLEVELNQSKSETQNAFARISALTNELVVTKKKLEETIPRVTFEKQSVSRVSSYNEGGLLRQSSTTSDVMETLSKRSVLSSKSSQLAIGRTNSIQSRVESSGTQRVLNNPLAEQLEAERLSFAEKLVQKEEIIAKLENRLEFCIQQLRQIEAGIDGVETRFDRELRMAKVEWARQQQILTQSGQNLNALNAKNEQTTEQMKKDAQRITNMVQKDLRQLDQNLQKQEAQKSRLKEESRTLQRKFDGKIRELEEKETQMQHLRDQIEQEKRLNSELREEMAQLEEKVGFLNSRLADLTIDSQEMVTGNTSAEFRQLNDRISSLEAGLAEYESKNRNLVEALDEANARLDEGCYENMDTMTKQNTSLKQELADVSEKLVDLEQENEHLRVEASQLNLALDKCIALEDEVQSLQKMKQELEGHLARKKKHIEQLQGELKELKLKIQTRQAEDGFVSIDSEGTVSGQVDAVLEAENRYEDLEKILSGVQAERDGLLEDKASKNKMIHSMLKETKALSNSLKKQQRQNAKLVEKFNEAKAEIVTLQSNLSVSSGSQYSRGRQTNDSEMEIMRELVEAKISLAEMDEKLIKLRRDHHKSLARNMILSSKANRLEALLREIKQEKGSILRRKTTNTIVIA